MCDQPHGAFCALPGISSASGHLPALVRPEVPRAKLLEFIANLCPCLIGMEACSGAHHWAREFAKFGHTVRLMAPKFVVPYRMSGKHGTHVRLQTRATCGASLFKSCCFVASRSKADTFA